MKRLISVLLIGVILTALLCLALPSVSAEVGSAEDFSALEKAVEEAEALYAEDVYFSSTAIPFLEELSSAKMLLAEKTASKAELDGAILSLQTAGSSLLAGGYISSDEDFLKLEGSSGKFILTNDITVKTPIESFHGSLIGNMHTITAESPLFTEIEAKNTAGQISDVIIKGKNVSASLFGKLSGGELTVSGVFAKLESIDGPLFFDTAAEGTRLTLEKIAVDANVKGDGALVGNAGGNITVDGALVSGAVEGKAALVGTVSGEMRVSAVIVDADIKSEEKAAGFVCEVGSLFADSVYYTGTLSGNETALFTTSKPSDGVAVQIQNVLAWAFDENKNAIEGNSDTELMASGEAAYIMQEMIFGIFSSEMLKNLYDTTGKMLCQTLGRDAAPYLGATEQNGSNVVLRVDEGDGTVSYKNYYTRVEAPENESVKPELNKEALTLDVSNAEALKEKDYTEASWKLFSEALAKAKTALENSAVQAELDGAKINLANAVACLEKAEKEKEKQTDYTKLQDAISKAQSLKEDNYTEESWEALQLALVGAKTVLTAKDQATVDNMTSSLNSAIASLVVKVAPSSPVYADSGSGCSSALSGGGLTLAAIALLGCGLCTRRAKNDN